MPLSSPSNLKPSYCGADRRDQSPAHDAAILDAKPAHSGEPNISGRTGLFSGGGGRRDMRAAWSDILARLRISGKPRTRVEVPANDYQPAWLIVFSILDAPLDAPKSLITTSCRQPEAMDVAEDEGDVVLETRVHPQDPSNDQYFFRDNWRAGIVTSRGRRDRS
eukprot:686551-Pyramimonas_sp.AAC.1